MPNALRLVVVSALVCALVAVDVSSAAASIDSRLAGTRVSVRIFNDKNKDERRLCRKAKPVRKSVIKKYTKLYTERYGKKKGRKKGKREPGRDICRLGNRDGSMPSVGKLSGYLAVLHRKKSPPAPASMAPSTQGSLAGSSGSGAAPSATLTAIAQCESGGNPATDTGNGFYGKYQFTLSTWQSVGGSGNPAQASEAEQDQRAAKLYAQQGPAPWPVCGR
jgi:hypothetical protein